MVEQQTLQEHLLPGKNLLPPEQCKALQNILPDCYCRAGVLIAGQYKEYLYIEVVLSLSEPGNRQSSIVALSVSVGLSLLILLYCL